MWFGLPAEVAVRCGHCKENDWRTPVELKSGRLVCFMCGQVSLVPLAGSTASAAAEPPPASAAAETVRRLATLEPSPRPPPGAAASVPDAAPPGAAGPSPPVLSVVPNRR